VLKIDDQRQKNRTNDLKDEDIRALEVYRKEGKELLSKRHTPHPSPRRTIVSDE
jgi:hypothetical protein